MPNSKTRKNISKRKISSQDNQPKCELCGKNKNLTKTECCGNWICDDVDEYIPFSYARNFATETTTDIRFVAIIMLKVTREAGKNAKSAGSILKQKCTFIMELMSIILRNWKILPDINRQNAPNATVSSHLVKMPTLLKETNTSVSTVIL